jgi:hypothetical protein
LTTSVWTDVHRDSSFDIAQDDPERSRRVGTRDSGLDCSRPRALRPSAGARQSLFYLHTACV